MTLTAPTEENFVKCIRGDLPESSWAAGRSPYLYRALLPLFSIYSDISGPTLDVSGGGGIVLPALKRYLPSLLPYSLTEIKATDFMIDGERVPCFAHNCERDRLPLPDESLGMIFFLDVIEHLLIDPLWALLEFNRVLKPGGHLLISTPNCAGVMRAFSILQGVNPAGESEYKPCAVYQRHNREWTPRELKVVLGKLGFKDIGYTTYHTLLESVYFRFLELMREIECTSLPDSDFGPEIVMWARKGTHMTLETCTDPDIRWPTFLYSEHAAYRKRPAVFPDLVGDDFA